MLKVTNKYGTKTYNVYITDFERSFNKLSNEESGRTQDGNMWIFPIGTFINYKLTVHRNGDNIPGTVSYDYDDLWDNLAKHTLHTIEFPYNQGTINLRVYITNATQKLIKQELNADTGTLGNYWGPIELEFIAKSKTFVTEEAQL